ncbi:hypothetical protein IL306_007768 [Fusarium sp. DS 682]|nr:hypothetical protein IL306_007768 [Fusarium sp. DS 682]
MESKATCIINLPRDVLVDIFSYFCLHCRGELRPVEGVGTPLQHKQRREPQQPHEKSWYSLDKHALFSVAVSCKKLHSIAEEILYHEFAPGYGDSELSEHYTYGLRLNQFMRTVGRRKDLAEKVRMILIHPKHSESPDVKQIILSLQQGARDLGIDIAAAWKHRAEHAMDGRNYKRCWELEYRYMLASAFTKRIFYAPPPGPVRAMTIEAFHRGLHGELTPMLIALLPKLEHLSYKSTYT